MLDPAGAPLDLPPLDAALVLEEPALPDRRRHLVLRHADRLAFEVGGPLDAAVGADVETGMTEQPRQEDGDGDVGGNAALRQHEIGGEGELGDIELRMAHGAEEDFLGLQGQVRNVAAVDRDLAVADGPRAVVIARRYGDRYVRHGKSLPNYRGWNSHTPGIEVQLAKSP